ncbi:MULTISPECIES: DUF742 domain-containing protein [Actinokineospora]|uniref:DUF742 domain-containing protein n=1 Tax=Actinokineospora fastidiosa TaxID=1816 RepID=A0A918GEK3_9PSEU|nr:MULTISPECIES: DUF742 domain-containing protein [Actinokineospora]UVS79775.1 hypothetical protein Actkin_03525 [Actinokineospora sp. UTMC 2448]GGS30854.1 hypothetical protein GCM10010171_25670 [Actinokineospora fastidiosa]
MGPDENGGAEERDFADLLNGFTLDKRRRRGGRHAREPEPAPRAPEPPAPRPEPVEDGAEIVRAYAWTAGRTRPEAHLEVETLVSSTDVPPRLLAQLPAEHHTIVELCRATRSVAEVAALLALPLGVVKVLLGDLAGRGLIAVHRTGHAGAAPDLGLMERVLSGLRRL